MHLPSSVPSADDHAACLPPAGHGARRVAIGFLVLAPLLVGVLAVALGQDANWDLRNYHWYNAYAFMTGRAVRDLLPSQSPYFFNPTIDIPFYLLASRLPAIGVAYALGVIQGLNVVPLFLLAHVTLTMANPWTKVACCAGLAVVGLLSGVGISLLGTTYFDNVTSLGITLSTLLVIRHRDRLLTGRLGRSLALALAFGLPVGMMVGLKLPTAVYCPGLCLGLLAVGGAWRRRLPVAVAFGTGTLAGAAATLGHWAWFLSTHFGSPLFPFFNGFFKSPLAPPGSARDVQFMPNGTLETLLYPYVFTMESLRVGEVAWRDWRLAILYTLAPAAIALRLLRGRRHRTGLVAPAAATTLAWLAVTSYLAWLAMFCVYRYLVPLDMLAPLLIVIMLSWLPLGRWTGAIAAALLLVIAASERPANWDRRSAWLDHAVEATVPEIADPSQVMVLMAGLEPYADVIAAFPPEIAFVRIESNFSSPNQDKGINALLRARVAGHTGRFLLLIPPKDKAGATEALGHFGLALAPGPCATVVDRLPGDWPLALCPVDRQALGPGGPDKVAVPQGR